MKKSPDLLDKFQNIDELLNIELEELAGLLFAHLRDTELTPPIITPISPDSIFYIIENLREKFGHEQNEMHEAFYALMEAYQWLQNEGLIALRPTFMDRSAQSAYPEQRLPSCFITRRGRKIKTPEDFEAYCNVRFHR